MPKATESGNFKPVPLPEPQSVVARCYSLIDIGTVPNMYNGVQNGVHRRIFLTWELPSLKAVFSEEKGPQPFVVSEEFTLSTKDNSNFSKLVAAWRGKAFTADERKSFEAATLVGKTCFMQIIHKRRKAFRDQEISEITNENTNLKLGTIMKRPKDIPAPEQINPTLIWDWDIIAKEGWDQEKFDQIPAFLIKKIKTSEEYAKYAPAQSEAAEEQPAQPEQAAVDPGPVTDDDW